MRGYVKIVVVTPLQFLAACSSLEGLTRGAGNDDAAPLDAPAEEGAVLTSGSTRVYDEGDGGIAVVVLGDAALADAFSKGGSFEGGILPNGGFEAVEPGCGRDWTTSSATSLRDLEAHAHSGEASCRLCQVGTGGMVISTTFANPPPGFYYAEAWSRSADAVEDAGSVQVTLHYGRPEGGTSYGFSPSATLTGTWSRLDIAQVVPSGARWITLEVHYWNGATCTLTDDVALIYAP